MEWISAKDRLPDAAGMAVLVYAENRFGQKDVFTAYMGYGDFKWYSCTIGRNIPPWDITHWMPLPEPPEVQDED